MENNGEDTFVNVGQEEKPGSSMTASLESGSSDGLVLLASERSSSYEGGEEPLGSSSNSSELEEEEGVDGLVLMGSTRLRPAPESTKDSVSKAKLYASTYRTLFCRQEATSAILPLALHGNLRDSPFRSLCWRVLLNVLPGSSSAWVAALSTARSQYVALRRSYCVRERLEDSGLDPRINNPLSQEEDSPWNQHFQDDELRKTIWQDVARTFPEVDFFQNQPVREMMVSILFVYARSHPHIEYRQGMHELLAPLVYVMRRDREAFTAALAASGEDLKEVPPLLFSPEHEEADTFSLFEALMEAVGPWYLTQGKSNGGPCYDGKPWSRPQDIRSGNKVVDSLNYIQDVLLKRHDLALYTRLEKLEIFPQIYGIRWLRLLFGREFLFADTLVLWDAILADSCPPSLADQLVVSLLMSVRELLLKYDYPDAVQLLMKLPSNLSVRHIISFALHLKDPLRWAKPSGSAFHHGESKERKMPGTSQETSRFRKLSTPSILRRTAPSLSARALRMNKIADSFVVNTPPDLPDFQVIDALPEAYSDPDNFPSPPLPPEEFETFSDSRLLQSRSGLEEDRIKMGLDRRKVEQEGEVGEVREELLGGLSELTKLLTPQQALENREEVFSQLRQLADLCNSLPRPPVAAEPALRSSGVYDFTPPSASPRDAARTRGSRARAEKQEGDILERPKELDRNTSLACDVSTYFEEE